MLALAHTVAREGAGLIETDTRDACNGGRSK
jgi:hypothetical protein